MSAHGKARFVTFEEFVSSELPSLAAYARALTGNRQSAHDTLADALVTAQLRWKRIGEMAHPAAYVRRIITTTFLGQRRRWFTRHVRLTATGHAPEQSVPDPTRSIDDREHVRQLLAGLPRRQRAAIVLRFYLGASDVEIATELGCSAGTVRSHVSRGLAALRIADTEAAGTPSTAADPSNRSARQEKS